MRPMGLQTEPHILLMSEHYQGGSGKNGAPSILGQGTNGWAFTEELVIYELIAMQRIPRHQMDSSK